MIDDLEREGLIKKLPFDQRKVDESLVHSHRDLETACVVLMTDHDWAYTIAYNAVLQAGRALMFSKGYRPDGAYQHIAVVKFAGLFLPEHDAIIFDRMRRKRHRSVYESAGSVSETEAATAVRNAESIVVALETIIDRT